MTVGVIVVAAGRGERLGVGRPKALVGLAGEPLVVHAVRGLQAAGMPPPVLVHAPDDGDAFREALAGLALAALIPGGDTRTASVAAGLVALADEVDVVLVHDAARALTPPAVIRAVADAIGGEVIAAAPGLPVADTLKRVEHGRVVATVDRADLVAVQTPQGFARAALVAAHTTDEVATDDLALVERLLDVGRLQGRVEIVPGSAEAMKVTYPHDLVVAEALLAARREGA